MLRSKLSLDDPYSDIAFPELESTDRMVAEYRMLRFSAELHPLTLLQDALPAGTVSSDRLPHLRQGSTVRVAGLVTDPAEARDCEGLCLCPDGR